MYNDYMRVLGMKRSVIRELFEYGKVLAEKEGADRVFDFSLGNPSLPPPPETDEAIKNVLALNPRSVHGYTSAQGDKTVREKVARYIDKNFHKGITADSIYMTCGAAAGLAIVLNALCEEGDEFISFAPYFPEYKVFARAAGGKFSAIPPEEKTFLPDVEKLEKTLTEHTKAVIINSPNNPSGVVVPEGRLKAICAVLASQSEKYGHPIYLISDEPYRELVYDGKTVPYVMNYYDDSIVCYSFSKSLSLPGERIGYIAVSDKSEDKSGVYAAICGAGRALGYVCAPSLMQFAVAECLGKTADVAAYKKNRDAVTDILDECGFEYVRPDGAFYILAKAPGGDANAFSEKAKRYGLLLVPSDDFGINGYVRIAYCTDINMITRSRRAFRALAENYIKNPEENDKIRN